MASSTKMLETEMKIQQAFMTLMHQEGFGKLSVQQLAKLAGISRGTFYLHYFDKCPAIMLRRLSVKGLWI